MTNYLIAICARHPFYRSARCLLPRGFLPPAPSLLLRPGGALLPAVPLSVIPVASWGILRGIVLGLVLACRAFLFPSGRVAARASPSMMAARAALPVPGSIGAPSVMGPTQATHATKPPGTGSLRNLYCPLPLAVSTPVMVFRLGPLLRDFPVAATVAFLLRGFHFGFDIGFRGTFSDLNSRPRNLLSARANAAKVSAAVAKEVSRGHTSGPFCSPPFCTPIARPSGRRPSRMGLYALCWIYLLLAGMR